MKIKKSSIGVSLGLLIVGMLVLVEIARAQIPTAVIEKARDATVLIANTATEGGMGSGVLINDAGLVLTNYHVIHRAEKLVVWFYDNDNSNSYTADVVAIDPIADLAVLRMNLPTHKLPTTYLNIESEEWAIAQEVVAIGHPMGIQWTVSLGHISHTDRTGRVTPYVATLQHSAEIHRGNSGGPLINDKGDVVGINTYLLMPDRKWSGIAYAVRGDIVQWSVNQMIKDGETSYPALKLNVRQINEWGIEYLETTYPEFKPPINVYGMIVLDVEPGGHADVNGIQMLDVVLAIDGEPTNHMLDVSNIIMGRRYEPGRVVELLIIRDRHIRKLEYPLGRIEMDYMDFYDESSKNPEEIPGPPSKEPEEQSPPPPHAEE